jgi:hypothetical protein
MYDPDRLAGLLRFVRENNRVCPTPQRWNELWESLPKSLRAEGGERPPLPLILAAWHFTSAEDKRQRFSEHIRYAHEHGALRPVEAFLRSLSEDEWAHGSEA